MNPEAIPEYLNHANVKRFREWGTLLPGYGHSWDERCIEWPWSLAQIPEDTRTILDAGSTWNHPILMQLLRGTCKYVPQLDIITASPEDHCYWSTGTSYIYKDLRQPFVSAEQYDVVLCTSTLKHIGMDNRLYGGAHEQDPKSWRSAFDNLVRMTRVGGHVVVTVPCGAASTDPRQQQFTGDMILQMGFGPGVKLKRMNAYQYSDQRFWQDASLEDIKHVRYNEHGNNGAGAIVCLNLQREK